MPSLEPAGTPGREPMRPRPRGDCESDRRAARLMLRRLANECVLRGDGEWGALRVAETRRPSDRHGTSERVAVVRREVMARAVMTGHVAHAYCRQADGEDDGATLGARGG